MTGLLIADTVAWGETGSAPRLLWQALAGYRQEVLQRSLPTLHLPVDLARANWGDLWKDYARLVAGMAGNGISAEKNQGSGQSSFGSQPGKAAIAISYPGSFGDTIDSHSTLADLCQDWRLSVLLTLPPVRQATSIAVAFAALARLHKTSVLGFVFVGEGHAELDELSDAIESMTRIPLLGHLPFSPAEGASDGFKRSRKLQRAAAHLQWELLPW